MLDAPLGQRNAFIEAAELEGVGDPHRRKGGVVGEVVDEEDDVAERFREGFGKALKSRPGDRLYLVG